MLWVKGSGGDLGTMKLDGFSTLYMEKFLALEKFYASKDGQGQRQHAGAAVRALRVQSESARGQHRHAAAWPRQSRARRSHASGRADRHRRVGRFEEADRGDLRRRDRLVAVDSSRLRARPQTARTHAEESEAQGRGARGPWPVHLGRHLEGLLREHARHHQSRHRVVERRMPAASARSAPSRRQALTIDRRREIAAGIMPVDSRHHFGAAEWVQPPRRRQPPHFKVGHFDDSETVLDFVGGEKLAGLAALGTSCPDHFLRTKIWPLVLPFDPARDTVEQLAARVKPAIEAYRERYAGYYDRCKRPGSPKMRDPNPGGLPGARRGHDHFRRGQGHRAHRRRVLRQRHQRDARRGQRFQLSRPARAGSLRHRILGSRRSQAAAHAEAEGRWPAALR